MTHRKCCCGGGGGSNTYGSCSKIDCDVEFEDEYCFEINGWKWLEILVYYARNLPQFGIRTHYDADGNPLADNTPVWWLRMDGDFDIQGSVDVRGFERFRNTAVLGGTDHCPSIGCSHTCTSGQKWYSGPTGACYTTDLGVTKYSYAPNAANGQTVDELCDFDECDPLRATVGYDGTANLQFRVFNAYRAGSASAPLVSATTVNQSQTVDQPMIARTRCLTRDATAGLETAFGPWNRIPNLATTCEVSDSLRTLAWNTTGFPATSADDQPTNSLESLKHLAPGCGTATGFVHRMGVMFAPIGSGSPGAVEIDCSCPNGDKQRQWASDWDEVVPTTPAASASDMFDDYPNGLNAYGSAGTFARVYAFNTPTFVWGTCTA